VSTTKEQQLASLAEKFLAGMATTAEQEQLHQLYDSWSDDEEQVVSDAGHADVLRSEIFQAIKERMKADPVHKTVIPFYKKKLWRAMAAASVVGGGLLLYLYRPAPPKGPAFGGNKVLAVHSVPVVPGRDKATLTLADGSVVDLDSSGTGRLAQQGNTSIRIKDGKIVYAPHKAGSNEMAYNTITTPRGGQYQVVLPDGTKVWLNATSYIKFPVAFTGGRRVVEVAGEAYFEVARNPAMPFIARVRDVAVEVLGTHFNIMAYGEEQKIAATLLEGSVKVSRGSDKHMIVPGQQAVWAENGAFNLNNDVDMEEVVAWKNGKFHFNNADIKTIMRQIARWYDVDVEFENNAADIRLGGVISRKEDIRQLLNYFEIAGKVRFKVEEKKIIVTK